MQVRRSLPWKSSSSLRKLRGMLVAFCLLAGAILPSQAIIIRLPTKNDALFQGKPEDFYMYVDRIYEGEKSKPWEGGSYGFVRTLLKTEAGPVPIKFHEGLDIKALERDSAGNPLDEVHPVAGGTVVHVSSQPGASNYGRYVVIQHETPDGPLYSLYAHLAATSCQVGEKVGTGNVIGKLGYSGVGINKERAHVHLELALMLSDQFQQWYDNRKLGTPNKHGLYNGLNLAGFNAADALLHCKDGADFSLSTYIKSLTPQYVVRVPNTVRPNILKRYPFLETQPAQPLAGPQASWEIAFTGPGVPISVTPSAIPCTAATVIQAVPHPFNQLHRTCNRVKGSSKDPVLTPSGQSYIRLLTQGS